MVGHGGSSAGSYLADPTSPIPSHCASIVATSTLRVNCQGLCAAASDQNKVTSRSMQTIDLFGRIAMKLSLADEVPRESAVMSMETCGWICVGVKVDRLNIHILILIATDNS